MSRKTRCHGRNASSGLRPSSDLARSRRKADEERAPSSILRLSSVLVCCSAQTVRSTSSFLIFAIAAAGLRPLGQVLAQFMIVWRR